MEETLPLTELYIDSIKGLFIRNPQIDFDVESIYNNVKDLYPNKKWVLAAMHLLLVKEVVVPVSPENDPHQIWKFRKGYHDKSWSERHATLKKVIIVIVGAGLALTSSWLLETKKQQWKNQSDKLQDSTLILQSARLDSLQKYVKDSIPHLKKDTVSAHN